MHRQFRELLKKATGRSEFVLAANLDIRGFSEWSRRVESREVILYLTKIYPKLIDSYFNEGWFFKPTGDGLLLIRGFDEAELEPLVRETVSNCFEIVGSFATLTEGEPMVNFQTPADVGIGLAQGAASRLVAPDPRDASVDLTLDYSGRVLNLASRLMELARPRGVVIDSGFGSGLLPEIVVNELTSEAGYIRGVSPDEEVTILFDPEMTQISESFKRKPGEVEWRTVTRSYSLKSLEEMAHAHDFVLPSEPPNKEAIKFHASHPGISKSGKKMQGLQTHVPFRFTYVEEGGNYVVRVDLQELGKHLRESGVKGPWLVHLRVEYPE